jgi:hypothetical protein
MTMDRCIQACQPPVSPNNAYLVGRSTKSNNGLIKNRVTRLWYRWMPKCGIHKVKEFDSLNAFHEKMVNPPNDGEKICHQGGSEP